VPDLDGLPRGMRSAVETALEPGEEVVAAWCTRGLGANALVVAGARALIAKRMGTIRWSVGVFPYSEIASVEVIEGRPGGAVQVVLVGPEPATPPKPGPFDDFPDAYFQESRRLVAPNTVMFRSRRRAREAVEAVEAMIAGGRHGPT
jgi:hypothetical protein